MIRFLGVTSEAYLKIVDHRNFNPRIIEHLTDSNWLDNDNPSKYPHTFIEQLENPTLIWERVFKSQISEKSRDLLIVLASLPSEVFLDDLFQSFNSYCEIKGVKIDDFQFDEILKELEGNFTITKNSDYGIIISFHNPSLVDFIENFILSKSKALYDIVITAIFFEQIQFILNDSTRHKKYLNDNENSQKVLIETCQRLLKSRSSIFMNNLYSNRNKLNKNKQIKNIGIRFSYLCVKACNPDYGYLLQLITSEVKIIKKMIIDDCFANVQLASLVNKLLSTSVCSNEDRDVMLKHSKKNLFDRADNTSDVILIFEFLESFPHMKNPSTMVEINSKIESIVDNHSSEDDYQILSEELFYLNEIEDKCFMDVNKEILEIESRMEDIVESGGYVQDPDWDSDQSINGSEDGSISDDELRSMFSTLN